MIQRYPGAESTARQLQAGASLIYEVYREFDPGNLLLQQAQREVMERQFEEARLARTLDRLRNEPIEIVEIDRPGPLALPLLADRLGTTLSTESMLERLARMGVDRSDGLVATEGLELERTGASKASAPVRARRGRRGRGGPRRPRI